MSDESIRALLARWVASGRSDYETGRQLLAEVGRSGAQHLLEGEVDTVLLACTQPGTAFPRPFSLAERLPAHPHFRYIRTNRFGRDEWLHLPTHMPMVVIPAGDFMMGSPAGQDGNDDERPCHKVVLSYETLVAKYPLTQLNWKRIMDKNPARFKGEGPAEESVWFVDGEPYTGEDAPKDSKNEAAVSAFKAKHPTAVETKTFYDQDGKPFDHHPVENVSWIDCRDFCKKSGLDMLSESEWEYSARAGTTARFIYGDDEAALQRVAVYGRRWEDGHTAVGTKEPNPWGLYDVIGLVWEWVLDEYHDSYNGAPCDGSAWTKEWEDQIKANKTADAKQKELNEEIEAIHRGGVEFDGAEEGDDEEEADEAPSVAARTRCKAEEKSTASTVTKRATAKKKSPAKSKGKGKAKR